MTLALPKRCAVVACIACAVLVPSAAFAQQPTTTTPAKTDTKTDPKKTDKTAEKKTAEQGQADKKSETADEKTESNDPLDKEATKAIFVSADLAFTRVDLGGLSDNTGFDKTGANGLLYGFATGLRLKGLRIGGRWRVFDTSEYTLWSLAGTIGYGLPLRPLTPIFSANIGYVWDNKIKQSVFSSSLPPGTVLPPDVDVHGLLLGLDINAAYWVTKFIRLGAFIGTDFMFLKRDQSPLPSSIFPVAEEFKNKPLYTDSGSSVAYTINIGLRGAFDVGF